MTLTWSAGEACEVARVRWNLSYLYWIYPIFEYLVIPVDKNIGRVAFANTSSARPRWFLSPKDLGEHAGGAPTRSRPSGRGRALVSSRAPPRAARFGRTHHTSKGRGLEAVRACVRAGGVEAAALGGSGGTRVGVSVW
jgi:hypothetical protein